MPSETQDSLRHAEPRQSVDRAHRRRRFTGRDPDEVHRPSTPLELLYDLTIVVAFGIAANELTRNVADGHVGGGVAGFVFASFAVSWAWLNYSWFASAYDTDDWVFRVATMVQMVGVVILALGLSQMFASVDRGATLRNGVMVAGYVVMRLSLVFLWWQVSRHDRQHRPAAYTYMATVGVAQIGWVILAISHSSVGATFALMTPLFALETVGPFIAERRTPTPWQAHHIADRYGLLVIITLGEVISGTVASLNVLVHGQAGWSVEAVLLTVAGVGLAFGCWWMYFAVPWAAPLVRHRERAFPFGYGHLVIFASLAATGAGVRVVALQLGGKVKIGHTATILTVAVPFAIFVGAFYLLYSALMRTLDAFHLALLTGTALLLSLSIGLAAAGVSTAVCLLVLTLAPAVTVVGYETLGHRHMTDALKRL